MHKNFDELLSELTEYSMLSDGYGHYEMSAMVPGSGEYWKIDDVQALLAQPLQQGDWKDFANLIVRDVSELDGHYTDEDDVLRVSTHDLRQILENHLMATPQPSDNLQQASTAPKFGYTATAADWSEDFAHESGNYENRCSECGIGFMGHKRRFVCKVCATREAASATDGPLKQFLKAAEDAGITHLNFKQATPEGADLPPLTFDRRWSLARDGFGLERNDESGEYVSHDDAVQVIHANLAATAAAEPVYQVASIANPVTWQDTDEENMERHHDLGYRTRTLYRAAPPQQVDTGGLPG